MDGNDGMVGLFDIGGNDDIVDLDCIDGCC